MPITTVCEETSVGKQGSWRSSANNEPPIADYLVGLVEPESSPRVTLFLPLLDRRISFLVDTGSPVSLLPWTETRQNVSELHPYDGRVLPVCGEALDVVGQCSTGLEFAGNVFENDFLITRQVNVPILGADFLKRYSVVIDVANQYLAVIQVG